MMFKSIRSKLTLWYVFILAIILAFFSSFLYLTLAKSLYSGVDQKIKSIAEVVANSLAPTSKQTIFPNFDRTLERFLGLRSYGKFIQILDSSGNVGSHSKALEDFKLPLNKVAYENAINGKITFETISTRGSSIRIVTMPVMRKGRVVNLVQVGTSLESVQETLRNLLFVIFIAIPLALALASVGGWLWVTQALRPVDEITTMARKISAENLNERLEIKYSKDEIGRLAETFNGMISRLYHSFRQIKQFTADASHELRTPLTVLKGEVEVALRKIRTPEEYQDILISNLEEINRMIKIVEDLLILSRADMGETKLEFQKLDMKKLLNEIHQQAVILASEKAIEVSLDKAEEAYVMGDELRIRQLLLNLIGNGIKYTPEGGRINLSLEKEDGFINISVRDNGIGIPEEDQPYIFDRFYRVDKARSKGGSGLGLSIAKWIAEAHRGSISVASQLGSGSVFNVKLPLC